MEKSWQEVMEIFASSRSEGAILPGYTATEFWTAPSDFMENSPIIRNISTNGFLISLPPNQEVMEVSMS
jgi:hypothetical protein